MEDTCLVFHIDDERVENGRASPRYSQGQQVEKLHGWSARHGEKV